MNATARRINALASQLGSRRYLEIGVLHGVTFRDVEVPERTAVDPNFQFDTAELANESTRFFRQTSDAFFANQPMSPPYDIVLIDGMHTFEQVVRDLSNVLLRTHPRSVIILDDTVPDDVYAAVKNGLASYDYRKLDSAPSKGWQGDVYKTLFYIHDYISSLEYRTIMGAGNPQTLVWRATGIERKPVFDDLEQISRLTYFDTQKYLPVRQPATEAEAIALCVAGVNAIS